MADPGRVPSLDETLLDSDPVKQFKTWLNNAFEAKIPHAEAMVLATATLQGRPSARVVLLKAIDERGFVFFSNYDSRKGRELASNPFGALTFHWAEINQQVRIEGTVSRLPELESDAYFSTRPRDGQLSSLASAQSSPIESRAELDRRFDEIKHLYQGKLVPRPVHWGGYCVQPETIEFWQTRFARLNDRVLYTRSEDGTWVRMRLQP